MKTLLPIALLASMTSSLCAQRYEIAALPAPEQNSQHEPLVKVPSARPIDAAVAAVADVAASEPDIRPVDPVADAPFSVSLRLVRNGHLFAKLAANQGDKPFLGILLAAAAPNTIQLPSLPPLLKTDYVVATGIDFGGMTFSLGPTMLGIAVYVQGVGVTAKEIAATGVLRIAAGYEPAQV